MAEVLLMPRLSDTMTDGVIASWQKKVGDTVKKGDVLAEIETDKATMELESYHDGTLLYIGVEQGGKLAVNDLMAIIGKPGEDVSALIKQNSGGAKAEPAKPEAAPAAAPTPAAPAAKASTIDISKMDEVVLMPRLSDTMTEGVIADWQKKVGDKVKKGEILADIETDKATMELESYKDGILLYQGAKAGEKIAVNDLLAIIGTEGTDVDAIVAAAKGGSTSAPAASAQAPTEAAAPSAPAAPQAPAAETSNDGGRVFASPLAKKIAADKGIDLSQVKGSGDNGRIVKADIENYTPQPSATPANQAATASSAPAYVPVSGQESFEEVQVSQMRKVIAKRLAESKFTSPHFYVTMAVDMDAAVAARPKLNSKDGKVKISFNDLVVKAVAVALRQHPDINSSWLGDTIRINHHIHVGVAVAVPDGLVVPVLKFADNMSLTQISAGVKTFATKAKDKKLTPAEMEGSTFTISNLGMYGVDQFTGIINPPNACILAVGGISQEPVVKNGQIVVGNVMKLTLSSDHRVVDGAKAAEFLKTLKELLEEPLRLLL